MKKSPQLLDSFMDKAQRMMGSAALVLSLILVAASVCFASVVSVRIALDSCDLGVNNRVREDSRIEQDAIFV